MAAFPNASSDAGRHAAIMRALDVLDTPADGWPAWVFDVPHDGGQYPGREDACPLPEGANCQRYAYAVLATQGLSVPPYFSSDLWEDPTMQHVDWRGRRPLDLVLFSPSDDPCGAHMGVVLGDAVLHLCHEVGVPTVWTLDDFASRQRYARLLGPVRVPTAGRPRQGTAHGTAGGQPPRGCADAPAALRSSRGGAATRRPPA